MLHPQLAHHASDDAPHFQLIAVHKTDRGKSGVFRMQLDHTMLVMQPFERVFAINHGQDDVAVHGRYRSIDNHVVAVHDADACKALAHHTEKKRCFLVPYKEGIQVQPFFRVIGRWRRKACRYFLTKQRPHFRRRRERCRDECYLGGTDRVLILNDEHRKTNTVFLYSIALQAF